MLICIAMNMSMAMVMEDNMKGLEKEEVSKKQQ